MNLPIVIMIGLFHTSMNFIGMLTCRKMKGSGYTKILFEVQLVTSGSLKGVLSGKAYAKSPFCLKTVYEAMERLLMERFTEEENITIDDPAALLVRTPNTDIFVILFYHAHAMIHRGIPTTWE